MKEWVARGRARGARTERSNGRSAHMLARGRGEHGIVDDATSSQQVCAVERVGCAHASASTPTRDARVALPSSALHGL